MMLQIGWYTDVKLAQYSYFQLYWQVFPMLLLVSEQASDEEIQTLLS